MRYFQNKKTGEVFGYDESDSTQLPYMKMVFAAGYIEVTDNYPTVDMKMDDCASMAKGLIAATDWAVLPDVNLKNKTEFETYRAALRDLITNPVAEPEWPTEPQPIWS